MMNVVFTDSDGTVYNAKNDLGLIVSKVSIGSPEPNEDFVEVPGMNGAYDASEALGDISYKPRKITIEVGAVISDRFDQDSSLKNALHGRRMKIVFSDDTDYYWDGRVKVGEWSVGARIGRAEISCTCYPFKLKAAETQVTSSIDTSYKTLTLSNARRPVVPTITLTTAASVQFSGSTYSLSAGIHRLLDIKLSPGNNTLKVKTSSGSGSVTITYREGSL